MVDDKETLAESLQNLIMSAKMEGYHVPEPLQSMYLSILNGDRTLQNCLNEITLKYQD